MAQGLAWVALWGVFLAVALGAGLWVRAGVARPAASGGYWRVGRVGRIAIAVVSILTISQLASVIFYSRSSQFEIARRAVAADPLIARSVGEVRAVRLSWINSASEHVMGPVTVVDAQGSRVVSERCAQTTIALVAVGPQAKQRVVVYLLAAGEEPWRVQRVVPESLFEATARKSAWDFSCE